MLFRSEDLYNPSRLKSYLNAKFLETNMEVAIDYLKGKFISGSSDLPKKEEGKKVSIHGKRYGAYRDENDEIGRASCRERVLRSV